MKKIVTISGTMIAAIALISILVFTKQSKDNLAKDNPYKTNNLEQSTIDLIGDKNYQDIILPNDLADKIEAGETLTVYFFSPECIYCIEMTPTLTKISDKMDIVVHKYNMLEFYPESHPYDVTGTPTLVHYTGGVEVARLAGLHPKDTIQQFLNEFETK